MKFKNIEGMRFKRLVVISFKERKNRHTYWDCVCDCGEKTIATNNNLSTGHTRSCGCLQKEVQRTVNITHGFKHTRFYVIWVQMKYRCEKPYNSSYHRYGGRGIKCLWKTFEDFKNDMYESYLAHVEKRGEQNTTIERIDNDKNYCKWNCRWATRKEQARNRRTSTILSFGGKTKTIAEWADDVGIGQKIISQRINRDGWTPEEALTHPPRKRWEFG